MREFDEICYAGVPCDSLRIVEALPLVGGMLLVTFSSGERRLFDVTSVSGSAFAPLCDEAAQKTVRVEHGFLSWLGGSIDLAPEYIYEHSIDYNSESNGLLIG